MATASPRRQRPRLSEGAGEDRLSALPDDLLMLILHRLDTRSALAAAALDRRWARLQGCLRALDFRVSDILPPAYHEALAHVAENHNLRDDIKWYRRRAMASYTDVIKRFVKQDAGDGREPRRVTRLRLEFFDTEQPVYVNLLIYTAVIVWGVEDLEVVVKPVHPFPGAWRRPRQYTRVSYRFPHEYFGVQFAPRIRSLTLGGFGFLPPLHEFGKLTELVLQDNTRPILAKVYGSVFSECRQLRSVHLRRCRSSGAGYNGLTALSVMEVDAPASELRELVVESCTFDAIDLLTLPWLDRLACCGDPVMLRFGHVPRLTHVNLSFSTDMMDDYRYGDDNYTIGDLMGGGPAAMTDLVARFTGPQRWVSPGLVAGRVFHALRRLLVADAPSTWDVSWPCLFLEAAPSLEALHSNVDISWLYGEEEEALDETETVEITWEPSRFRHRRLKELVLVGFERTPRRACLVRYAMKVCTALQRVVPVKGGRVDVRRLWGGWEVVAPPREGDDAECPWSDEEKLAMRKEIRNTRYFKQNGQVIFA